MLICLWRAQHFLSPLLLEMTHKRLTFTESLFLWLVDKKTLSFVHLWSFELILRLNHIFLDILFLDTGQDLSENCIGFDIACKYEWRFGVAFPDDLWEYFEGTELFETFCSFHDKLVVRALNLALDEFDNGLEKVNSVVGELEGNFGETGKVVP